MSHIFCRLSTLSYYLSLFFNFAFIYYNLYKILITYNKKDMYNLNDIQQNLKELIKQLKLIQNSVAEPQEKKKNNQAAVLLRIPKGVLLIQICSFLSMQEINYLSNTCSTMRKTIYSPLGWKFVSRLKTPYPIQIVYAESDFKAKMKKISSEAMSQAHMQDYDDEKYIAQERNKFKTILLNKFSNYLKSKQRYEAHRQKVRTQQGLLFKMKQQIQYLDGVRKELDEKNRSNKQKLKQLSQGFSARIKEMDDLNDSLMKERTKLQNQKQALAGKIREYQHEIQVIKEDSQKSKQILKRLKNYLLYKEL